MLNNLDDLTYDRRAMGCNVLDDKIVIYGGKAETATKGHRSSGFKRR